MNIYLNMNIYLIPLPHFFIFPQNIYAYPLTSFTLSDFSHAYLYSENGNLKADILDCVTFFWLSSSLEHLTALQ